MHHMLILLREKQIHFILNEQYVLGGKDKQSISLPQNIHFLKIPFKNIFRIERILPQYFWHSSIDTTAF